MSKNIETLCVPIVADAKNAVHYSKNQNLSAFRSGQINKPLENRTPINMGKKSITLQMIIRFINKCFENAIITTDVG